MKISTFSNILKKAIDEKAMNDLINMKSNHTKVLHLKHTRVPLKKYLKPNLMKINKEEMQFIYKE